MRELTIIRDAVIAALRGAGLTALAAFPPERARRYRGAVAAVAVGAAEGTAVGFCNYLGEEPDASGAARELYGKILTGDVILEVRAGRAEECEEGCALAAETLLGGLPQGIRPGELRWEALQWERSTEMFLRRGSLRCRAVFVARSGGDGDEFLDFRLKGVLESERG